MASLGEGGARDRLRGAPGIRRLVIALSSLSQRPFPQTSLAAFVVSHDLTPESAAHPLYFFFIYLSATSAPGPRSVSSGFLAAGCIETCSIRGIPGKLS